MDLIYACHIKNNNWHELINYNLSKIEKYLKSIIIVYSHASEINYSYFEEQIKNTNVVFIKVENTGYDFKKYKIGLLSMNIKVENKTLIPSISNNTVILMNDSFIFSRDISDIMNSIKVKRKNNMFIGLSKCDLYKIHYQSYFWVLDYQLSSIMCDFLTPDRLDDSQGIMHIIQNCEIALSNKIINSYSSTYIFDTGIKNFYPQSLYTLLETGYPIIKLKALKKTKYDKNSKIIDFNPTIYKHLHSDLSIMNDQEATYHFFKYGMLEGRKYKYNQLSYMPKKLKLLLDSFDLNWKCFVRSYKPDKELHPKT